MLCSVPLNGVPRRDVNQWVDVQMLNDADRESLQYMHRLISSPRAPRANLHVIGFQCRSRTKICGWSAANHNPNPAEGKLRLFVCCWSVLFNKQTFSLKYILRRLWKSYLEQPCCYSMSSRIMGRKVKLLVFWVAYPTLPKRLAY